MRSTLLQVCFSYSATDDQPVVGGPSRFGFVSMVRLNLVQALARLGIPVHAHTPSHVAGVTRLSNDRDPAPETPLFASMLRRRRLDAGLSQEALAERARISVNGLSSLERGTRRTPQRETLALLVEALALRGEERASFEAAASRNAANSVQRSEPSPPFDIALADLMIVVLTQAWLSDESCRAQLARFVDAAEGSPAKHRILVVRRDAVEARPSIGALEGNAPFDFFREAAHDRPNEPFYRSDGTPVAAFYDVVDALTQAVRRHKVFGNGEAGTQSKNATGHAVFVAPPTDDMEAPYRTLVAELRAEGYVVLPPPSPGEANLDDVDLCLSSALCSIHLLGNEEAFDDAGRSRVSFPLARAAVRARASDGTFRRILFAPKLMLDRGEPSERDPIEVRDRYAESLPSDTICGDVITEFVLAAKELIRSAERRAPLLAEPPKLTSGNTVFVNFHPGDVRYARDLAKALRERGLRARFAAVEDDKIANKIANAGLLRESSAVVHCWANASDAWLYAEAADYEDWRKFGRAQPFFTRAAVAGPPERGSKMLYSSDDPPEAIDVYVDLTMRETPLPSDLDPIVSTINEPRPP